MGMSDSVLSYQDCQALFDKADASEKGIKVVLQTYGEAVYLRTRMSKYRVLLRKQSKLEHSPGEPGYNTSPYDYLALEIPKDSARVGMKDHGPRGELPELRIRAATSVALAVEEL